MLKNFNILREKRSPEAQARSRALAEKYRAECPWTNCARRGR
jgi:hypothetical protein